MEQDRLTPGPDPEPQRLPTRHTSRWVRHGVMLAICGIAATAPIATAAVVKEPTVGADPAPPPTDGPDEPDDADVDKTDDPDVTTPDAPADADDTSDPPPEPTTPVADPPAAEPTPTPPPPPPADPEPTTPPVAEPAPTTPAVADPAPTTPPVAEPEPTTPPVAEAAPSTTPVDPTSAERKTHAESGVKTPAEANDDASGTKEREPAAQDRDDPATAAPVVVPATTAGLADDEAGSSGSAPTPAADASKEREGPASSEPTAVAGKPVRWRTRTIKAGESLWSIAAKLGGDNARTAKLVARIWDRNQATIGSGNPDVVPAGIAIRVPETTDR